MGEEGRGLFPDPMGLLTPSKTLARREGGPLNWPPSADAVAGKGGALSWGRGGCADGAHPEPSAHAVAGRGSRWLGAISDDTNEEVVFRQCRRHSALHQDVVLVGICGPFHIG